MTEAVADSSQRDGKKCIHAGVKEAVKRLTNMKRVTAKDGKPVSFGIVLFPGFQLLDAAGPLDALNILSLSYKMNLYIIAETMDPVSTKRPVDDEHRQKYQEEVVGVGSAGFAERIVPTHTFATAPPLDVLIIPGGIGTRFEKNIEAAVGFIGERTVAAGALRYLITVCTGAGLAARAGVLDGKRATTNKMAWDETTALGPKVEWVRKARWVRAEGGQTWTSAGVSAGIDVMFAWISEVYGEEVAGTIAKKMEYRRVMDSEDDPFTDQF